MADAPSGGGSSWGSFEIILGVLLVIGLLSNIGHKGTSSSSTSTKKESLTVVDNSADRCGLSVVAPLSLEKVSGSVHLAGLVSGCNWKADGTTALFAQVVSGGGVPLSDFISVQNNDTDIINTAFDTTIALTGSASGTGYLILIPATQTGTKSISVRIPLRFVRN